LPKSFYHLCLRASIVSADGKEIAMMESGAILLYLAEKSGKFLSKDPVRRLETLQWLFFQVSHTFKTKCVKFSAHHFV
jgi:glutathione S-transferase